MMKFKLVESFDDRLVEKINWTDEQIRDIIDMYTAQGLGINTIAAKYNVSYDAIKGLLQLNNIQTRLKSKKYPVYLNTISHIEAIISSDQLSFNIHLEYKPSINLGDYTASEITRIYNNLRKRISSKSKINGSEIFAFYMKLLQEGDKEANIKQLIGDILNIDNDNHKGYELQYFHQVHLLTVDDQDVVKDNDLVDFYSYQKIAEEWLANLGVRIKKWAEPTTNSGKYLKELALQYYTPTVGDDDYKEVIEKYSISNIIYSLFDKYGNRIDSTNYKNMLNKIPYENEFNISSLEDLQKYFKSYGRDRNILYGYLDNRSRIVYVGITQSPYSRGYLYGKSDRETRIIAKALTANLINKLVIFKSYLPTSYSESSSKLLRQLEIEFAEKIFKTYSPENRKKSFEELVNDGTLNIDKPGKNQNSYIVNSIQDYAAELAANSLLSKSEYEEAIRSKFGNTVVKDIKSSRYSYLNYYLPAYISNHKETWKIDFLLNNVSTGRGKWLYPKIKSLDELENIMKIARIPSTKKFLIRNAWKDVHNKTNQNNRDDLDDNIDGDNYK